MTQKPTTAAMADQPSRAEPLPSSSAASPGSSRSPSRKRFGAGIDRYIILIVWAGIISLFGILRPTTFLTELTLKTILADQAITCMLAVAITVALAAGIIDLSFAAMTGFAAVLATRLSEGGDSNPLLIFAVSVIACVALGVVTAALVTWLKVNSLIASLGMLSIATGLTQLVTGGVTLTGQFSDAFSAATQGYVGPVPLPFLYALVLGVIGHFLLEHTPTGRKILAVGSNAGAARLAGLRVGTLQTSTILATALVAALAGVVLAAKVGQATNTTATGYLLPVIAAVFLGSTQFKGRVNVIGSIVAVLTLGTGIKGLQLMGATPWVADFFNGAVLLAAVAFGAIRARRQT